MLRRAVYGMALLLCAMMALGGCSLQKLTVDQTADVMWDGRVALESEPDPELARDAFPASLKTIETFLVSSPDNDKLLRLLAKGYFSYAFAFVEADFERAQVELAPEVEIERAKRSAVHSYIKARDYGFRLLDDEQFEQAARGLKTARVKELLEDMDEDDVPGLFWTAYGWGSAANLDQQNSDLVGALPIIEAMMQRVLELDERFFYSGPHLFFGVYYASRPPMFGGDPDRAKKHFEAAMRQNGHKNLLIPFLYARFYAVQTQDRPLFERLLNVVETTDVKEYDKLRLNNAVARQRAAFWADQVDDLFL